MKKGALVISLDFELVWGLFDHIEIKDKATYFNNTLQAIPQILSLFDKKSIHATWATVGMLFNENWEEWQSNIPVAIPTYDRKELDAYDYGKKHQKAGFDQFFFAPDLIKNVQSLEGQEIGTHTYSHYYCQEKGQTKIQYEADLNQAIQLAQKMNLELKSLVFPRNQFQTEYLEICGQKGIETVRSNPDFWYWDTSQKETLAVKLARTGDAYLPFGRKSYGLEMVKKSKVICQPASRFLRPQNTIEFLNSSRLNRIKSEMIQAAKLGEVYHLWWHPHNFGVDVSASIQTLKSILETFQFCNQTYGMQSLTMKELSDAIRKPI